MRQTQRVTHESGLERYDEILRLPQQIRRGLLRAADVNDDVLASAQEEQKNSAVVSKRSSKRSKHGVRRIYEISRSRSGFELPL